MTGRSPSNDGARLYCEVDHTRRKGERTEGGTSVVNFASSLAVSMHTESILSRGRAKCVLRVKSPSIDLRSSRQLDSFTSSVVFSLQIENTSEW